MLYNQLESILHPFFMSRWGSFLANKDVIWNMINLVIQDIYNEYNWNYKFVSESIDSFKVIWNNNVFVSSKDIDCFTEAIDSRWKRINPTIWILRQTDDFNFSKNNIYFSTTSSITWIKITYTTPYIWYNPGKDGWNNIPLPDKFIPAIMKLVYDYASPISLFDGEQSTIDFFGHYRSRIQVLKELDVVAENVVFIPPRLYNI